MNSTWPLLASRLFNSFRRMKQQSAAIPWSCQENFAPSPWRGRRGDSDATDGSPAFVTEMEVSRRSFMD